MRTPPGNERDFDARLEELVRLLEIPEPLSAEQAERMDDLARSLEAELDAAEPEADLRIEGEMRDRLAQGLRRQAAAGRKPAFGRHLNGIGPTLGMDLSDS